MNRNTTIGLSLILLGIFLMAMVSHFRSDDDEAGFTEQELAVLDETDSIMRVLTIEDSLDLAALRAPSRELSAEMLLSDEFKRLSRLMIATVTHPSQDGVGIAAPQVGLNRRVVAVQRFDKPGEPFEIYPNVSIVWASDSLAIGPEGCLSVPERRGDVLRSHQVVIEYVDMDSLVLLATGMTPREIRQVSTPACQSGSGTTFLTGNRPARSTPMVQDTISGFTAVIFQHEIDHLDGILYIDRL